MFDIELIPATKSHSIMKRIYYRYNPYSIGDYGVLNYTIKRDIKREVKYCLDKEFGKKDEVTVRITDLMDCLRLTQPDLTENKEFNDYLQASITLDVSAKVMIKKVDVGVDFILLISEKDFGTGETRGFIPYTMTAIKGEIYYKEKYYAVCCSSGCMWNIVLIRESKIRNAFGNPIRYIQIGSNHYSLEAAYRYGDNLNFRGREE